MKRTLQISFFVSLMVVGAAHAQASTDPRDLPADAPTMLEFEPKYQWTELHWAVRRGQVDRVRDLMRGGNLEARDFQGRTPLHIAVLSGWDDIVEMLLAAGADVNARDQWGITPLRRVELIEEYRGWDRANIAQLLREAGGEKTQIMPRR